MYQALCLHQTSMTKSGKLVSSNHMELLSDFLKTGTKSMITQSDSTMTQSHGTMLEYSDASEAGSKGDLLSALDQWRIGPSLAAALCQSSSALIVAIPGVAAALGSIWTGDSACAVCGLKLGKRKLRPRHHCRVCGDSVCGECSPSRVQLVGKKALQRVCSPCVLNVQVGSGLKERLDKLSNQVDIIGGSCSQPLAAKADTLENALRKFEVALPRLDHKHRCTQQELQEWKTMCLATQDQATETETQLKQLRKQLRVLKAESPQKETPRKWFQGAPGQWAPSDDVDGLLF